EGDDISQSEPMIFEDTRDALTNTATISSSTTANNGTITSSSNNNSIGSNIQTASNPLNISRLTSRNAITGSLFADSHSRRQVVPATPLTPNLSHSISSQQQANTISVNTTNSLLARAFAILIRQITDLLIRWPTTLSDSSSPHDMLTMNEQNSIETIQNKIEQCLLPSWQWFATVMDSFESQLRFGMTLSNLTYNENDTTCHGNRFLKNLIDRAQIETKKKPAPTTTTTNRINNIPINDKPVNNRLDFLNYSLSLMRSTHEHGDQEPLIDVLSYKHLAYLLDGFIYYFRENGPDAFQIPIDDSLPLACRPQLLQPVCRKEDLFGRFLYDQTAMKYSQIPSQLSLTNREHSIPDFLQPNYLNLINQTNKSIQEKTNTKTRDDDRMAVDVLLDLSAGLTASNKSATKQSILHSIVHNGSYEYLLARWKISIELFVKLFLDDVGSEPGSIINESSGFSAREQRFRHDMERLKNIHQKDIRFESMERDRILLIQKTFR
ncbi:unnamed protein product, partial [Adineta steineri]